MIFTISMLSATKTTSNTSTNTSSATTTPCVAYLSYKHQHSVLQHQRVQRYGHTNTLFTTLTSHIKGEFVSLLPFRGRIPVIINKLPSACRNIFTAGCTPKARKQTYLPDALRPYGILYSMYYYMYHRPLDSAFDAHLAHATIANQPPGIQQSGTQETHDLKRSQYQD
jgi:hypothetical protein